MGCNIHIKSWEILQWAQASHYRFKLFKEDLKSVIFKRTGIRYKTSELLKHMTPKDIIQAGIYVGYKENEHITSQLTRRRIMYVDLCKHCELRGDIDKCRDADCQIHNSWYAGQLNSHITALEIAYAKMKSAANGLTNYCEDRPGLHKIVKEMNEAEQLYKAI